MSDNNELTVKTCPVAACKKIGVWKDSTAGGYWLWLVPPPCFRPRPAVTFTVERCPEHDAAPAAQSQISNLKFQN